MTNDFRRTTRGATGTVQSAPQESTSSPNIVAAVTQALQRGVTVAQVAEQYRLPKAFIEQIVEHERALGKLTIVELNAACGSSCVPDPESVVCASCPLASTGGIKRRNLAKTAFRRLAQRVQLRHS
ncbi:hypothetical protein [Bifidobacterium gallicum]|uniref:Peptidase n=1 Tax=Bifidobacterium gallicum DSM 20093 = LMG 11596 TaxID=561180 RepID=D1NS30_9BIFI|nr:hypothetical protein [Bifidobacterium gallicum]EFA23482.1 hypothetical protein BIFGAL_02584 [Bifidobacterium gallicum DSM 20093 = LMG 11596]KFI57232.1 peptidase [Bifidobacterium gallicum DSM 20093 = LMG 11596]